MSGIIRYQKSFRRSKPRKPLVEGDADSGDAVTDTRYAEVQSDGSTIIKSVRQRLDSNTTLFTPGQSQIDPIPPPPPPLDYVNYEPTDMPPSPSPTSGQKKARVS